MKNTLASVDLFKSVDYLDFMFCLAKCYRQMRLLMNDETKSVVFKSLEKSIKILEDWVNT